MDVCYDMGRHDIPRIPVIEGDWWQVGNNPDLGDLTSEEQEVVDHCFFQASDGKWQLWACIRAVKVGRIFYRWQGDSIEQRNWTPMGIAMRSDSTYGESQGNGPKDEVLQAPHVIKEDQEYYMLYGGGGSPYRQCISGSVNHYQQICLATSLDGYDFFRHKSEDGYSQIFHGLGARDPMVIKVGNQFLCYYSVNISHSDVIALRTSFDLVNWSDYTVISSGRNFAPPPHSDNLECPFVVFLDGYFYLFRSSRYEPPINHVFRSKDPMNFGIDNNEKKITTLAAAAPEIVQVGKQFYISTVADVKGGIQIARLRWEPPLE
jgi:hypothetical protein